MDKTRTKNTLLWGIIVLLDLVLVLWNQSTYDSGDSILHYLYSKQAFNYPQHFLNHWAKPLFVLLSSPFAYLGWAGMKVFNALCIIGSAFYTYKIFQSYNLKPWLAVLFCFAAPQFFLVQASGLTEPLFTLGLIAIIYHLKKQQYILAIILLSFLPFVRSEGWIIWLIISVYMLVIKQWKYLVWIITGTVIYGIIGVLAKGDFLWMFHQNPYAGEEVKYGSGQLLHYVDQLPYVIGFPLFMFLLLGLFDGFQRSIRNQIEKHEFFTVYGVFLGYIVAHSMFWYMGWFHSFGLNRVLIVLIPLVAFIAYRGIERIICAFRFVKPAYIWILASALLVVFPFTSNKAALGLPESFQKEPLQRMIDEIGTYCYDKYPNYSRIYYGNTYFIMSFDKDMDDPREALRIGLLKDYEALDNSLILWDSYFAVTDQDITESFMKKKEGLEFIKRFECEDCRKSYFVDLYRSSDH